MQRRSSNNIQRRRSNVKWNSSDVNLGSKNINQAINDLFSPFGVPYSVKHKG